MVGGAQEKKIVSDMRLKVKETLSQKRKTRTRLESQISQSLSQTAFPSSGEGLHAFDIANTASAAAGATVVESNADLAVDYTTLAHEPYPTPATLPAETSDTTIKDIDQSSHSFGRVPLDEGEASLWMHYLDKTFPHQFPFYKPTASEGGRGWLFILVMQTEPLYHAVLSIAAYHQHYELLCENGEEAIADDCSKADEQLRRYDLALRKLQIYLNESLLGDKRMSKPKGLRLLACVVFLISLEAGDRISSILYAQRTDRLLGVQKHWQCLENTPPSSRQSASLHESKMCRPPRRTCWHTDSRLAFRRWSTCLV
jgi:hypothetical protein